MRLTRQSNYAIRTLVYCAVNSPDLSRIADIAKAHSISELFLFKLHAPLNFIVGGASTPTVPWCPSRLPGRRSTSRTAHPLSRR